MADATVKRTGMIGLGAMGVQMAKHACLMCWRADR
jgi:3-hydroxyisobutyrate dehydrogenase-like beta-hydroxyacid dehydrogenase